MDGDTSIGRRKLLVGAGAGLGALALASVPAVASADPQNTGGLTGSWLVHLTFNELNPPLVTLAPETAVNSFAAGGAFAAIVLSPPGAPAPALGTWAHTGDHSYKATVWQSETLTTPNGPFTIALRVHLDGTFSDDQIHSTFTFDVFLPSNPMTDLTTPVATGSGTSSGSRISA